MHCAQQVLKGIKEQTGIGDDLLEQLSFVSDGGIGLQSGACGALAGAIMGVNLLIGMNVRDMTYCEILKAFAVGHENLLTNKSVKKPEPFNIGIVKKTSYSQIGLKFVYSQYTCNLANSVISNIAI